MANQTANTSMLNVVNTTTTSSLNITKMFALDDEADDAIWILTSTFIIFTMQSGKLLSFFKKKNCANISSNLKIARVLETR